MTRCDDGRTTPSAQVWAEHCHNELFNCHRGAFELFDGCWCIFANDDASSPISQEVLRIVLLNLALAGGEELDFAMTTDGYTWCLIAKEDTENWFDLIWDAADVATTAATAKDLDSAMCGLAYQRTIAANTLLASATPLETDPGPAPGDDDLDLDGFETPPWGGLE